MKPTIPRNDLALTEIEPIIRELRLPATAVTAPHDLSRFAPSGPVTLPDGDDLETVLDQLALPPGDRAELRQARPDPTTTPALWWLLERCVGLLRERLGSVGPVATWPELPEALGPAGRQLYTWALLAALPAARAYHRDRGIPDALSWAALAVLSAQRDNHRRLRGVGGLHTQDWLTHHFRGAIYVLGRLHFERSLINFDPGAGADGPAIGAPALGLHIPEGRLTPESCDAALTQAADFFPRHFRDEPYRFAVCSSWVLDPQLKDHLAPDSNIIRFQDRFTLAPDLGPDQNETIVEFVFKRPFAELAGLPRETSLQRGIIDHIRDGGTWRFRTGWFRLPAPRQNVGP